MAWRIREERLPTIREGEREFREGSASNRIHRRDRLPNGSSRRRSRRRSQRPLPINPAESCPELLHSWKRERSQLRPRRHHNGRLPVNNHGPPTQRFTRNPQAILRLGRIVQGKLGECKSELG